MRNGRSSPTEAFSAVAKTPSKVIGQFIDAIARERTLSTNTLDAYRSDLVSLERHLRVRGVELIIATEIDICNYIAQSTNVSSKARQLSSFRRFYRYRLREPLITIDPTSQIAIPKVRRALLPVLRDDEMHALLAAPDVSGMLGHRDRAMIEVLCDTGVRVSELINIEIGHIDLDAGTICIESSESRSGLLQLHDDARSCLSVYLGGSRDEILLDQETCYLFPTRRGTRMTRQAFWQIVKRYGERAGIRKRLSPDTLRIASLRSARCHLGHSSPSTTQPDRDGAAEAPSAKQGPHETAASGD